MAILTPSTEQAIAREIIKATGLPKGTADFSINFPVGGFITINAKIVLHGDGAERVQEVLRKYHLFATEIAATHEGDKP